MKCDTSGLHGGRNGGSGKSRKASGTAQSRVDHNRDESAMSSMVSGKMHKHPAKTGNTRPL